MSDSWCSSASRADKVSSVRHMVAYDMLPHQLITPRWKWSKHSFPNRKSRRHKCSQAVACSCSFTCYSGRAISSVLRTSIANVTHQSRAAVAAHCREPGTEVLSWSRSANHVEKDGVLYLGNVWAKLKAIIQNQMPTYEETKAGQRAASGPGL